MASTWHLAQLNIARLRFSRDNPAMNDFNAALDPVNAVADASDGFVWRLQDDTGNATAFQLGDDDSLLINMSLWTSLDALLTFVRHASHVAIMSRRKEWFDRPDGPHMVLWWVPAGHIPDLSEAAQRLGALADDGPTADAFTFSRPFPPPGA